MTKEVYLDILKKWTENNDLKHKSYLCMSWLLYNCTKVIITPAQSPDINPIENLWVHIKKKVRKISKSPKKYFLMSGLGLETRLIQHTTHKTTATYN